MPPKLCLARTAVAGVIAFAAQGVAAAQDDGAFYRGKVVTIVIGAPAGSTDDAYARLIARHLGTFTPGRPQVAIANATGSGGRDAAAQVAAGPQDGTVIGAILSVGLALVQFTAWQDVAIVAAIFAVGQVIEGNLLQPKLVGDRVGLHPLWVVFALLAGGVIAGLIGVMLAVPVAAALGVVVRHAIGRYLKSALYSGPSDPSGSTHS